MNFRDGLKFFGTRNGIRLIALVAAVVAWYGVGYVTGNEMPVASMRDCSVVTATYDLGDGMKGTVGIIGPRRMDYERVVDVLRHIMQQLDDLYKQ